MSHVEVAEIVLDESGFTQMWQNDKSPEAPGRLENLKELVRSMENFANLQGFLEHISLVMENDQDLYGEKVSIMTLHGAKGLEFDCVFIPGLEDGLFPSQRSMDESGQKGLEEERRLAYVGITRARKYLTLTFSANRRVYGQWQSSLPSRFIEELPSQHVEVLTAPGLYRGQTSRGHASDFTAGDSELEQAAISTLGGYNSPGWSRLKQTQPTFKHVNKVKRHDPNHAVGARVFHQKFGYGIVIQTEGEKAVVNFEHAGEKHVMASFLMDEHDV
jgi:DNA helicase-2/ATP-dependent DNA helicase PcrA